MIENNIMKLGRYVIAACALCIVCKEDAGNDSASSSRSRPIQPIDTAALYESLLGRLCTLQDSLDGTPRDSSLTAALYRTSLDTENGAFLTVGKAAFNPEFPEAARRQARSRAALYVGERWALYMKAWHTGEKIPFGAPVSGTITYSKELYKKEIGDTLYQLILTPIGSVVLESASVPASARKKRYR